MIETALYIVIGVLCVPILIVAAGYLYGRLSGTSGGMDVDDAVSKGLEYRRDVEDTDNE